MQQLNEQGLYTQPERRQFVAREQENTKLVQQIYEHFKTGEIKALLNLLSVNIEWQLPEIENVPFAGKRRGHEEMGQFFESLVDTQEFQHFDPREFRSEEHTSELQS